MSSARVAAGDLKGLDALEVDALALFLFADKRQPKQVAGYVDWRMCGRIARLILSGRFLGDPAEALLMPAQGRMGAKRIFLFGLGPPGEDPEDVAPAVASLMDAGAKEVALAGPVEVLAAWLRAADAGRFTRVVLLDADGALERERNALEAAAKKSGFAWSDPP